MLRVRRTARVQLAITTHCIVLVLNPIHIHQHMTRFTMCVHHMCVAPPCACLHREVVIDTWRCCRVHCNDGYGNVRYNIVTCGSSLSRQRLNATDVGFLPTDGRFLARLRWCSRHCATYIINTSYHGTAYLHEAQYRYGSGQLLVYKRSPHNADHLNVKYTK